MSSSYESYSFRQQPRPVPHRRNKYRDPHASQQPSHANIMWDPRVFRGNTYAVQVLPTEEQQQHQIRQSQKKRRPRPKPKEPEPEEPSNTEPVEGRQHLEIQTEQYLEEITDRPIESDVEVQTEVLLDRPPPPVFVPQKSGEDVGTQIEDGELFDFDTEVEPLVEVIVGKTLEQSVLEVMQEDEMEQLEQQQQEYERKRNMELAETQRLEAAEQRRWEEKERRKEQERKRVAQEREARHKLTAMATAKSVMRTMETKVMDDLTERGFFYDAVERSVDTEFMPWLIDQVKEQRHARQQRIRDANDVIQAALDVQLN
eukprot:gb/GECH01003328.1/.p1 GENE.gb/GECH01003328.1/~~gb/GECH01003328.1/.p1  ORF type:complete len:315 (+),score=75.70 gb/GECH01003328.1/:1-945(+)